MVARRHSRGYLSGLSHPGRSDRHALRHGLVHRLRGDVLRRFFLGIFRISLFPVGGVWPPKTVHPFDPFEFPFLNTLILLLSGTTVTWAHHSLIEGDRNGLLRGLALTIFLGLCFTSVQAYEYSHAPFHFTDGIYPSTFFMATGFHGFHVIIGTTFCIVSFGRGRGDFKPDHHFGFEAAAWYWHFVDVVWLFLFVCVYWWGEGTGGAGVAG